MHSFKELGDYEIKKEIFTSASSKVYLATHKNLSGNFVIKAPAVKSSAVLKKFENEIEILTTLKECNYLDFFELFQDAGRKVIVINYFGDQNLRTFMEEKGPLSLIDFFKVATSLASSLQSLHNKNIIHRDLSPENFIYQIHPKDQWRLIDFNLSLQWSPAKMAFSSNGKAEGTLAYISPEQTGRINREITYLSDIYSLGIIFYELLTGRAPFKGDPLELIHNHVAKPLPSINRERKEVSSEIDKFLASLTQKDPMLRYQNAHSIVEDLKELEQKFLSNQTLSIKSDVSRASRFFKIPNSIYGNDVEVKTLERVFKKVINAKQSAVVFLEGPSGSGKSTLAGNLKKACRSQNVIYGSGKSEHNKKDAPLLALSSALDSVFRQFHSMLDDNKGEFKAPFRTFSQSNLQLLNKVIPSSALVSGVEAKGEVDEDPQSLKNRVDYVVRESIYFLANLKPVILFLDDMQWADDDTFRTLENILAYSDHPILVLISSRTDLIEENNSYKGFQKKFSQSTQVNVENIKLGPISTENLKQLILDAVPGVQEDRVTSLAQSTLNLSQGNQLFSRQILIQYYKSRVILFNETNQSWEIDLNQIPHVKPPESVSELLISDLDQLPVGIKTILGKAAVIGHEFSLFHLDSVSNMTQNETVSAINHAISRGYISIVDSQKSVKTFDQNTKFEFHHDQIQSAALKLIDEDTAKATKWKTARILFQSIKENPSHAFEIVEIIGDQPLESVEQKKLYYNAILIAAKGAKITAAYESAIRYYEILIDSRFYEAEANTYLTELMECYYSGGKHSYALEVLEKLDSQITGDLEFRTIKIAIYCYAATGQYEKAVKKGISYLKKFRKDIDESPSKLKTLMTLINTRKLISKKVHLFDNIKKLTIKKSEFENEEAIVTAMSSSFFFYNKNLFVTTHCYYLRLNLRIGGPFGLYFFRHLQAINVVFQSALHDFKLGHSLYDIIARYLESQPDGFQKTSMKSTLAWHASITNEKFSKVLDSLERNLQEGQKSGNNEYTSYMLAGLLAGRWIYTNLSVYDELFKSHVETIRALNVGLTNLTYKHICGSIVSSLVHNRTTPFEDILKKSEVFFDNYSRITYLALQLFMKVIMGRTDDAKKLVPLIMPETNSMAATFWEPWSLFYMALCLFQSDSNDRKAAARLTKKLAKFADAFPENFNNKLLFLQAEEARSKGRYEIAGKLYEASIAESNKHGFIAEEALALEYTGNMWIKGGFPIIGTSYRTKAYQTYAAWGAKAKAQDLEQAQPELRGALTRVGTVSSPTSSTSSFDLNIMSIIKATQYIASTHELEDLSNRLLEVTMENATAEAGVLVQKGSEIWKVTNSSFVYRTKQENLTLEELEEKMFVDKNMLQKVLTTRKPLIYSNLEDIAINNSRENMKGSLMLIPIKSKGQVQSILCLYNSLPRVFTQDRQLTLEILASQADISLQNLFLLRETRIKAKLEADMEAAESIQNSLLPRSNFSLPELELAAHYKSADQTGGDWYGYYHDEVQNIFYLCCGDVTGHGISAAIMTGVAKGSIESLMARVIGQSREGIPYTPEDTISEIFSLTNSTIFKSGGMAGKTMSMSIVGIELDSGKFWFGSAGHVPPLVINREGTKKCITIGNILGLKNDTQSWTVQSKTLAPQDCLVIYTDGLVENEGPENRVYGEKHLRRNLHELRTESCDDLLAKVLHYGREIWQDNKPEDDCTILVAKWLGGKSSRQAASNF